MDELRRQRLLRALQREAAALEPLVSSLNLAARQRILSELWAQCAALGRAITSLESALEAKRNLPGALRAPRLRLVSVESSFE